jgi:hypothetical protein
VAKKREPAAPRTYGDLRKLLAAAGNPWQTDTTKSDDEPLPRFPTGGDGKPVPAGWTLRKGDLDKLLRRASPPSHPDLRAEWGAAGYVVDEDTASERPKRSSQKRPTTKRSPNSGG